MVQYPRFLYKYSEKLAKLAGGAVEYDAITENFAPEVCRWGNRNGTWHCVVIFDSKRVVRIPLVPASASIWSADDLSL